MRSVLGRLSLPPSAAWVDGPPLQAFSAPGDAAFPKSTLCRQSSFETPYFQYWTAKLGFELRYYRKLWEFVFICQSLWERGLVKPGMRGLGFGVGAEPLAAYFASEGCQIMGTDMEAQAAETAGWTQTAQHAVGKAALRRPTICPDAVFEANVEFSICDMNAIPDTLSGYDFCWSACALEHLGSIEHGLAFIERSIGCLKPGGVAVHTTEFNLSSNTETMTEGATVLFRRSDLEELERRVSKAGHTLAPLDLEPGLGPVERYIDTPPYRPDPHLTLALSGYAATSLGLIIQKAL
jgi:2-polyprenyl-3-methyl-5-hydroxy-6-metoxy-1,4-benzoquinol methylase